MGTGDRISDAELRAIGPAIPAIEAALQPLGMKGLLVLLDKLSEWATGFNIPHDPKAMPAAYRYLADFPADLVAGAFKGVMEGHKDTFRLPMPAKIADSLYGELTQRRDILFRLRNMQTAGRSQHRSPGRTHGRKMTPEEFEAWQAEWAKVKAKLAEDDARRRAAIPKPTLKASHVPNPSLDAYCDKARKAVLERGAPAAPEEAADVPPPAVEAAASVEI